MNGRFAMKPPSAVAALGCSVLTGREGTVVGWNGVLFSRPRASKLAWGCQFRGDASSALTLLRLWSCHMLAAFGPPPETSRFAMARLGWNCVRREGVRSERTSGEEDWPLTQLPRAEQPKSRGRALLVLALVVLAALTTCSQGLGRGRGRRMGL